jgi:hypothetical protein
VVDRADDDVGDIAVRGNIGHVPAEAGLESQTETGSTEHGGHALSFALAAIVSLSPDASSELEFGKAAGGGGDCFNVDPRVALELG